MNANKRIVLCQGDGVELSLEGGAHEADYHDRTGYCEARFAQAIFVFSISRSFNDEISRRVTEDRVKYDVVTNYEQLMDIVGRAATVSDLVA